MEFAPNNNIFENIKSNDSINYMEYRFLDDDFEDSIGFDDVADDDLEDVETNNNDKSNNIFLIDNYLNHDVKNDNVILNLINPPNSYREVSIAFSRNNINNLLKGKINNKQLIFKLKHGGKNKVSIKDKELERIIYKYIETVKSLNLRPFSYFDEDVVTSFINFYKDGTINSIVSYYLKSVQVRNKKNSSNSKNIMFTFNVDKFRELHFGITPDCMNFNPHEDREMFILDYIRMYWELYMLLVFMDICNITEDNEKAYFVQFYKYITLAIFTGMKMFLQLEIDGSYGELYEELKGFKTKNNKYLSDGGTKERQQIVFKIKNSDFLTEAYKNEYQGAVYIDKNIDDIKNDKHIDIEFVIMQGSTNNSVLFEVTISGQYPLGRIYSADTKPDVNINLNNMYHYGLDTFKPVIYLFRTCLNYCKDLEVKSYYTELQGYLSKYKGIKTHGLVTKLLSIILLTIYKRPDYEGLTSILNKYFKPTDKVPKAEVRRIYKELKAIIPPNKDRIIDKMKKELWKVVW